MPVGGGGREWHCWKMRFGVIYQQRHGPPDWKEATTKALTKICRWGKLRKYDEISRETNGDYGEAIGRDHERETETGACGSPRGVDDRHTGNLRIILCDSSLPHSLSPRSLIPSQCGHLHSPGAGMTS